MEQVSLLFEISPNDKRFPMYTWFPDWFATKRLPQFDVHLFNYEAFLAGEELVCEPAPKHDMPALLRCHSTNRENYERLAKKLLSLGYRLITDSWRALEEPRFHFRCFKGFTDEKYKMRTVNVGASFGTGASQTHPPSIYITRDDDGYLGTREADWFALGWHTSRKGEELAERFAQAKGDRFSGEAFFEEYVPRFEYESVPVVWRAFYFEGRPIFKAPVAPKAPKGFPEPPEEIVNAFRKACSNIFYACDFMLAKGGSWLCSRFFDGQMSEGPARREDSIAFYEALARAVEEAPRIPDWIWCLTAEVRDENKTGVEKRVVHGTRHFAPHTKVFLHPPNWDERVGAIGIPRYSDKRVRIVVDVRKLEHFALEKVNDREIVCAMLHPYNTWPFTKMAPIEVGRGTWGQSESSKREIEDCVKWLNSLNPDGKR